MSAASESFSALDAIESGRWDAYLHRLHGAIHQRQSRAEYKATLVAGPSEPDAEDLDTIREGYWHP